MAPRPRKAGNKDLPDNLYPRKDKRNGKVYYSYRDPRTGVEYGLGSDKSKAIRETRAANLALIAEQPTLLDRISKSGYLFRDWSQEYRRIIQEERELSPATIRNIMMRIKTLDAWIGEKSLTEVTTLDFTERFKTMAKEGKAQMAKALRSLSNDVFREAIAAGRTKENPITVTKAPRIKIKRERLSLEQWQAIYECAEHPWLKRAMELGIVTLQRREDIASMKFTAVKDGSIHIIQSKTKRKLRISEDITLDCVGLSVAAVIKRCRDNVASPYLVHHHKNAGRAVRGQKIMLDTLSKEFAAARDRAVAKGMIAVGENPPTFHEMRSLGARLYQAQGYNPQMLLGHADPATTELYKDSRGSEWLDVSMR